MRYLDGGGDPVEAVSKLGYTPDAVFDAQRHLMDLRAMRLNDRKDELSRLLLIASEAGSWKLEECYYMKDGVCTLWRWDRKPSTWLDPKPERQRDGYHIHPDGFYCAFCNEFRRKTAP